MSKAKLRIQEEHNRKLYKIQGGNNYQLRSRNAIYISPSNSVKHELAKTLGVYMIRKYGDIKFTRGIILTFKRLELEVKKAMEGFAKEKDSFITECVPKKEPSRRVDLVRLSDNTRYEFVVSSLPEKAKTDGSIIIKLK